MQMLKPSVNEHQEKSEVASGLRKENAELSKKISTLTTEMNQLKWESFTGACKLSHA